MKAASICACATLALAGCRGISRDPVPESRVALPDDWSAGETAGAALDGPWWQSFGEPTLTSAIEEALTNNRDLAVSAARVRSAAALADLAGADRKPTVDLNGQGQRSKQIFVGLPVPGGNVLESTATSYGVSLDVAWEADLWGRLSAGAKAAAEELSATLYDERAARHSIAAQSAKAWFAWQGAEAQVQLAQTTVASYESTLAMVQRRFESGRATAFDLQLAEADVAAARLDREARRNAVEQSVRQLELLLGRYPPAPCKPRRRCPIRPPRRRPASRAT